MTGTGQTQVIPPADGYVELRGVALLMAAVLLAWAGGLTLRQIRPVAPTLASHQRSAFESLDPQDQGLFSDLRAAAAEIRALQGQQQAWPEPAALAAEAIAPFVPDAAWTQRGRLEWRRLDAHAPTHAVYWGRNATIEWALVINDANAAVWRRSPREDAAIPQAIPEMLVLDGWQEFVPRQARSP